MYKNAVDIIKTAILQSQARAAKAVNQEQLALYYGIGRYVSANSRKKNWGKGAIETIMNSTIRQLQLPKLQKLTKPLIWQLRNDDDRRDHEEAPIGIILCKNANKDYAGYIMQDFKQLMGVATYKTADEMDPELLKALPPKEELQKVFMESSNKKN